MAQAERGLGVFRWPGSTADRDGSRTAWPRPGPRRLYDLAGHTEVYTGGIPQMSDKPPVFDEPPPYDPRDMLTADGPGVPMHGRRPATGNPLNPFGGNGQLT